MVETDDALKRKADEAFPDEGDQKVEKIQPKAEEQKLAAAAPEKQSEMGQEAVKETDKVPDKMENTHQEPQTDEDAKADQVLGGWSAPQGDELKQAIDMEVEEPKHIQIDEPTREVKAPDDTLTPSVEKGIAEL